MAWQTQGVRVSLLSTSLDFFVCILCRRQWKLAMRLSQGFYVPIHLFAVPRRFAQCSWSTWFVLIVLEPDYPYIYHTGGNCVQPMTAPAYLIRARWMYAHLVFCFVANPNPSLAVHYRCWCILPQIPSLSFSGSLFVRSLLVSIRGE